MKIFISYASARRDLAEPLVHALEADGHEVFFDRQDLPVGDSYHERIRDAMARADQMVFLISPESIKAGSYALSELAMAQQRWPRPAGHVLPVMAAPTPYASLPPYLTAVTVFEPKGNLAAEVAAELARRRSPRWPWWAAGAAALVLSVGAAWMWQQATQRAQQEADRQIEAQARTATMAEIKAAASLCTDRSFTAAWGEFERLNALPSAAPLAATARTQCAMQWLRGLTVSGADAKFAPTVDMLQPVLVRAIAGASGETLADVYAHLGWAEFLRSRDGLPADPAPHYQRAIDTDARNPFGHAMLAHHLAWRGGPQPEVHAHFETALSAGREQAYVRHMQIVVAKNQGEHLPGILQSLNLGRKRGEAPPAAAAGFYQRWCEWELRLSPKLRSQLLDAMSADDASDTMAWLQALKDLPVERQPLWQLCRSAYLMHDGRHAEGEAIIREALRSIGPAAVGGSYERWARELLAGPKK